MKVHGVSDLRGLGEPSSSIPLSVWTYLVKLPVCPCSSEEVDGRGESICGLRAGGMDL